MKNFSKLPHSSAKLPEKESLFARLTERIAAFPVDAHGTKRMKNLDFRITIAIFASNKPKPYAAVYPYASSSPPRNPGGRRSCMEQPQNGRPITVRKRDNKPYRYMKLTPCGWAFFVSGRTEGRSKNKNRHNQNHTKHVANSHPGQGPTQ